MLTLDSVVVAAQEQVSTDLGGETAILNLKNGEYYSLNEVGSRIWTLIQQPCSVSKIRDALLAEYEVDRSRCEQDLFALLAKLEENALLETTNGSTAHSTKTAGSG